MRTWWTTTRPVSTAAPAATTTSSPALCWGYAITRSGERRNGAPPGAAWPHRTRTKHYAKTTDSGAFVPVPAVYAAPGHGLCRGGGRQRHATSAKRPVRTPHRTHRRLRLHRGDSGNPLFP